MVKTINTERSKNGVCLLCHDILQILKLIQATSFSSFTFKLILDSFHFCIIHNFLNHYFVFHYKTFFSFFLAKC